MSHAIHLYPSRELWLSAPLNGITHLAVELIRMHFVHLFISRASLNEVLKWQGIKTH